MSSENDGSTKSIYEIFSYDISDLKKKSSSDATKPLSYFADRLRNNLVDRILKIATYTYLDDKTYSSIDILGKGLSNYFEPGQAHLAQPPFNRVFIRARGNDFYLSGITEWPEIEFVRKIDATDYAIRPYEIFSYKIAALQKADPDAADMPFQVYADHVLNDLKTRIEDLFQSSSTEYTNQLGMEAGSISRGKFFCYFEPGEYLHAQRPFNRAFFIVHATKADIDIIESWDEIELAREKTVKDSPP